MRQICAKRKRCCQGEEEKKIIVPCCLVWIRSYMAVQDIVHSSCTSVLAVPVRHVRHVPLLHTFSDNAKEYLVTSAWLTHIATYVSLHASCYSLAFLAVISKAAHYLDEQWDIVSEKNTLEVILRHDAYAAHLHGWDHIYPHFLCTHTCRFKNDLSTLRAEQCPVCLSSLCSADQALMPSPGGAVRA